MQKATEYATTDKSLHSFDLEPPSRPTCSSLFALPSLLAREEEKGRSFKGLPGRLGEMEFGFRFDPFLGSYERKNRSRAVA